MPYFLILTIITIILYILAIVFFIVAISYILKRDDKKGTILNTVASLTLAIIGVIANMNIEIPEPIILPLNGESKTYVEDTEITINSDEYGFLEIYYTIDGQDPQNGNLYEGKIIISESTTVCARNKFLWFWSDFTKSTYLFEKKDIINNGILDKKGIAENHQEESDTEIDTNGEIQQSEEATEESGDDRNNIPNSNTEGSEENNNAETNQVSSTETTNTETTNIVAGQNPSEGMALISYVNQYRIEAGVNELNWSSDLEQVAQNFVANFAEGKSVIGDGTYYVIGRQCNGAKNAQKAVSDWITGNAYIPSEVDALLNTNFTQMGGALYYLPDGNEYGYHYFWIVCMQ